MCCLCGGVSEREEVRQSCVGEGRMGVRQEAPKKPVVKKQTELV